MAAHLVRPEMSSLSGNSCWVTSWLRLDTGSSSLLPCFWILRHPRDIYTHTGYDVDTRYLLLDTRYICCPPESILESQGTGFVEACLVWRRRGVEEGVVGSGQYRDVWGVPLRERHGYCSGQGSWLWWEWGEVCYCWILSGPTIWILTTQHTTSWRGMWVQHSTIQILQNTLRQ